MARISEAMRTLFADRLNRYNTDTSAASSDRLLVTQADGTPVGSISVKEFLEGNWWQIQKNVEGYIRVAEVDGQPNSDPALSYKHYAHKSKMNPDGSPYALLKPCLVGNNVTGNVGKILHVLKKLGATTDANGDAYWEGEDGKLYRIDGSDGEVLICNTATYHHITGRYTIDGVKLDVFLRSKVSFTWNGISSTAQAPFGWSPDYCVAHADSDGKTRMHSVYNPNWAGSRSDSIGIGGSYIYTMDGNGNVVDSYDSTRQIMGNDAGGLHTTDISLPTGEQYAMNLNTDTTKTYPYMNHTAAGAELLWAGIVSEGGTFDAHNANLMGSGFSSNDPALSASDWAGLNAVNGVRFVDKNSTTQYRGFGYLTSGSNAAMKLSINTFANMLNSYRNPWKIMEAHRAVCFAIRNGIPALTWFAFEGNKYKWRGVTGFDSPTDGEMTCVVWKVLSGRLTSSAKDPSDGTTALTGKRIDFLVSTALWHGITTQVSPSWWTSGLVFTEDENKNYKAFMQRDQSLLVVTPDGEVATGSSFNFESVYTVVTDGSSAMTLSYSEGYRKDYNNQALMLPSVAGNKAGGGLHTYVGGYNFYTGGAASSGKKTVRGFRRGYSTTDTVLSPLCIVTNGSPSNANSIIAFGICCQIVTT